MFHEEWRVTPIFAGVKVGSKPAPSKWEGAAPAVENLGKERHVGRQITLGDNGGSLGADGVVHSQEWLCYRSSRICMDWSTARVG